MKKVIKLITIFICIILISGCGKNKVLKCEIKNDQSKSGYTINTTYEIYSSDSIVNKVVRKDVVTSKNTTILAYFEKTLKDQYKKINDNYGGNESDVKIDGNKVVATLTSDYNKMDFEKYIKDNTIMKSYVNKNNKLTMNKAKTFYESMGATCK